MKTLVRALVAIGGGYGVTTLVSIGLARVLPVRPAAAVMTALLVSFLFYAAAVIWVFAYRSSKGGFRQSMAWLHTWAGLLPGWVLYFVFVTGTTGYFDTEIDRWMRPELPLDTGSRDSVQLVERGLERLRGRAPAAARWTVELPNRDIEPFGRISWRMSAPGAADEWAGSGSEALLGGDVEPRRTGGGQLLYQMHYRLHYLDDDDAAWIVGFCAMALLVALISGVIAHRRIFRDFFTFRPGPGPRSWLDAHNVLGVVALPFHLMITYSGLVFFMYMYMPFVLDEVYRLDERSQEEFFDVAYPMAPPEIARAGVARPLTDVLALVKESASRGGELFSVSVRNPGDANARVVITRRQHAPMSRPLVITYDGVSGTPLQGPPPTMLAGSVSETLLGLHEGLFAGPVTRWLYFLSGLLGSGMIATGLVLWTLKRRAGTPPATGLWLVERLNAATIAGLPIAIASYFWANRLLPVTLQQRGVWEAHILFGAWIIVFVYTTVRAWKRTWMELIAAASVLYLLLPLLNALTTERHLGITLPRGDWALAGFDLTALVIGALFGALAWRLRTRRQAP